MEIIVSEEVPQLEDKDDESIKDNIILDIIEVTGENVNTLNVNILEMYFQGVKSGGGRDKEVEWIRLVDDGVAHVKFVSTEGMYNISFTPLMYM